MTKALTAIGLMSGTSMDGVDVALIETDGETVDRFGPTGSRSYTREERALVGAAVKEAKALSERTGRAGALAAAEQAVTQAHADAVRAFLSENHLEPADVDVIGFHGQTVVHRPDLGFTVQLADGPALARALGIDVVFDLRAADMTHGGQGAPLAPVYHRALVLSARLELPVVVVNIGGVGNVTFVGEGDPIAFDTGPGNALIDDFVCARTGQPSDLDGRFAATGRVDETALSRLRDSSYFDAPPPKSLDRNAFSAAPVGMLSLEDGAATLAAFTAATIARSAEHFPALPRRWIVSGGGAHNPSIMRAVAECVAAPVVRAHEVGWAGDHLEAQAFAFLAVRSLKGLPLTFPTTTGVDKPATGGILVRAA